MCLRLDLIRIGGFQDDVLIQRFGIEASGRRLQDLQQVGMALPNTAFEESKPSQRPAQTCSVAKTFLESGSQTHRSRKLQ